MEAIEIVAKKYAGIVAYSTGWNQKLAAKELRMAFLKGFQLAKCRDKDEIARFLAETFGEAATDFAFMSG